MSESKVAEKSRSPLVRQFSVFLENKVGALLELTRTLKDANIHVCGISVVDTADTAVVRIVVDDPDKCRDVLHEAHMATGESALVVVELPRGPEKLDLVLRSLVAAEVNIQYTYGLMVRPRDKALLALSSDDPEYAREVLDKAGYVVMSQKDISPVMAGNPTPSGLAIVVCDQIIEDKATSKKSLIGIFNNIASPTFPCRHPQLSVFVSLTEGRGNYQARARIINEETQGAVTEVTGQIQLPDVNMVAELVFNFIGLEFPAPGLYSIEFYCDDSLILERRFHVMQAKPPPKGPPAAEL